MDNKIKDFADRYRIWDEDTQDISYLMALNLIKKYLTYGNEDKYEKFILELHKAIGTESKHINPPKLLFQKMLEDIDLSELTEQEVRKFKIEELLKGI